MKNILVFSPLATDCVNGAILLDMSIQKIKNDPNLNIYFVYLDSKVVKYSDLNYEGSSIRSKEIEFDNKVLIAKYKHSRIHYIPLSKYVTKELYIAFDFANYDDIKRIEYKGINIGYGVVSSLVSAYRNTNPDFTSVLKEYLNGFLCSMATIVDGLLAFLKENAIDSIYTFNGRFSSMRIPVEVAINKGIEYICVEQPAHNSYEDITYIEYRNSMPHSISYATNLIKKLWNERTLNDENNAIQFFDRRAQGKKSGDKVYVSHQIKNKLPNGWDSKKRNFVFFSSSEDEFYAIGQEWENLKIFKDQIEAIEKISEICKKDSNIHIYLRVHPNLMHLPYKYAKFPSACGLSNVTVIPAESSISTYSLLHNCEKCITAGSTIGAEATYWGVPSVLVGPCRYYYVDVAYTCKDETELEALLLNNLTPKDRENALMYSNSIYFNGKGKKPVIIDFIPKPVSFRGKELEVPRVMKIFGSSLLYDITLVFFRILNLRNKSWFNNNILTLLKIESKNE